MTIVGTRRLATTRQTMYAGQVVNVLDPAAISSFDFFALCVLCGYSNFLRLSREAQLLQQRLDLRLAAAKLHEGVHRIAAAALFED